jgi:hypothetical protein
MSLAVVESPISPTASSIASHHVPPRLARALWLIVGLFLLANVPAFLRMGLDADATFWDLCARNVLRGGTHYRDAAENNLPGMLWLHLAIRGALGWSSEALRFADLLVIVTIVMLLQKHVPAVAGGLARPLTALVLFACYFTTSEWCHCQRDTWMLLPALVALQLRGQQLRRIQTRRAHAGGLFAWAVVEGVAWAMAFWIKPFAAIPALSAWSAGTVLTASNQATVWKRLLADLAGLLAGGLSAGAAGTAWIFGTGAFPAFREIMLDWNAQYVGFDVNLGASRSQTLLAVIHRTPWILVNLAAFPLAVLELLEICRRRAPASQDTGLLAALYVGWLFQSFFLQHPYDYVFVPPTLLGLVVVAGKLSRLRMLFSYVAVAACLVLACAWQFPQLFAHRIALWASCASQASNPRLRDELSLYGAVKWEDMDRVAQFLKGKGVRDGELTCYAMRTIPLYEMLDVVPSTRFYALENCVIILGRQRALIKAELARSRQRYVVHDLKRMQLSDAELESAEGRPLPVPQFDRAPMPWSERIVYRAGRYIVLAIPATQMPLWIETSFGL